MTHPTVQFIAKMADKCSHEFYAVKITATKDGKTFVGYFDKSSTQLYPQLTRRLNAADYWCDESVARRAATKIGRRKWVDAWGFEWEHPDGMIRQLDIQDAEICTVKITWELQ